MVMGCIVREDQRLRENRHHLLQHKIEFLFRSTEPMDFDLGFTMIAVAFPRLPLPATS
jgi:hypothetical protein